MSVVLKGPCDQASSCEMPTFPSWAWRFNRNQHMTHYVPWQIREEQKAPQNRNMGMHRDFRFHPMSPRDGPVPMIQLGVNACHELIPNRRAGFGNSALGRTPGPAPPRMFAYMPDAGGQTTDSFYPVNEIHGISAGMSLFGYRPLLHPLADELVQPLNPSHYLDKTLNQKVEIPGTFPHFNKNLPSVSHLPCRKTPQNTPCEAGTDLMGRWRDMYMKQLARHARERCCYEEPASYSSHSTTLPRIEGQRRQCHTARR